MTEKDLFGKQVRKKRTRLEILLAKADRDSLPERVERLRYLRRVVPNRLGMAGSMEHIFTFNEAQAAFLNGQYIGTLLLAQAFVERLLQSEMNHRGYPGATRGLKYIVKYCTDNQLLPLSALRKIDHLRKIRNPFAHLKPYDYPYNLSQRIFERLKEFRDPEQMLFDDAKEAISVMIMVLFLKMG